MIPPEHTPRPAAGLETGRVLLLGGTGTIGRATLHALIGRGYEVVCVVRPDRMGGGVFAPEARFMPEGSSVGRRAGDAPVQVRAGNVADPMSWSRDVFRGESFDAVISCLASRSGVPADAWAIDHEGHVHALEAARASGVRQMVLLSAICVQKPMLEFQRAKRAFEQRLIDSGLGYSIVRPTAFFKSLSGQVARVRAGKPFLVFGDGRLTACKPIDDHDLARYLVDCLADADKRDRILPIGGPGPAITPLEQGERLFEMLGLRPRFRHVPVAMLDLIVGGLGTVGRVIPGLAARAELARIGRYYATESMLVWDRDRGRYDADATPSTGARTLWDHYRDLIAGVEQHERGEHSVF